MRVILRLEAKQRSDVFPIFGGNASMRNADSAGCSSDGAYEYLGQRVEKRILKLERVLED